MYGLYNQAGLARQQEHNKNSLTKKGNLFTKAAFFNGLPLGSAGSAHALPPIDMISHLQMPKADY
ncbi:hypothetical protein [Paenibacillus chibensis]|uniref:hypothetical protein n=1 Tax=Paenibacillus chibensis TaxID=59846 RepID=UPI0013E2FF42|nr:hypothetical protein [Paenibacillus chibensis]MEC0369448.1 hypothetical protein [Paenibacillus chibensis]